MESGILAMTEKVYVPRFADNVYQTNPTLARLRRGEKSYDGGSKIAVPLEYAELASGGSFNGLDLLATTVNDIATLAEYDWRQYYVTFGWSRKDYLMNKGSKTQVVNMVEASTKNASKKMQKLLTTGLFQATKAATTDIDGLVVAITAASTTDCGGLDSNDFSTWAAQRDTSTTKLSLTALNKIERDASDGDDRITLWVSTDAIYGYFYDIATPLERLQDKDMAALGFTSLSFNGKPFISDKSVTAGYIHGLNENHIWLGVHSEENMRYERPVKPLNQAAELGQIFWMGNICTDARRRLAQFSAVTS